MLKIIARICIILLAAGVVCGGFYLYAKSAGANLGNLSGGFDGGHGFRGTGPDFNGGPGMRPQFADGDVPSGLRPEGGRGDRDSGSWMGAAGILKNLGIVALITALVALGQKPLRRLTRRHGVIPAA